MEVAALLKIILIVAIIAFLIRTFSKTSEKKRSMEAHMCSKESPFKYASGARFDALRAAQLRERANLPKKERKVRITPKWSELPGWMTAAHEPETTKRNESVKEPVLVESETSIPNFPDDAYPDVIPEEEFDQWQYEERSESVAEKWIEENVFKINYMIKENKMIDSSILPQDRSVWPEIGKILQQTECIEDFKITNAGVMVI